MKGRAPKTGYSRDQFGSGWASTAGCDTRNRILRRDLNPVTIQTGTQGCLVVSGRLADPYTGRTITMTRGVGDQVQIDHVTALSDAWQKGAQGWSSSRRISFANDPLNLLAVDGSTNESKGDGDAATWLPPNKSFRCAYVARQIAVKSKYGLWVTAAEKAAMARILTVCPNQPKTSTAAATTNKDTHPRYIAPKPRPTPKPKPTPSAPTTAHHQTDPRFETCAAANRAGYGPYVEGKDPEYDWYQDRDHDGIDCER